MIQIDHLELARSLALQSELFKQKENYLPQITTYYYYCYYY